WEAVSYAWGDTKNTSVVHLPDGSVLPIKSNLDSFLRHRREKDRIVTLWIDALCINQEGVHEKNHQVQNMSMVYGGASRLTIWLGPAHSDSKLAVDELKCLGAGTPYQKISLTERKVVAAIADLLSRPWWSRFWIIQEVRYGILGKKSRTPKSCVEMIILPG
ncbi:hypothetical protein EK21DRAFT_79275, partial [Setomelanomma holmii]